MNLFLGFVLFKVQFYSNMICFHLCVTENHINLSYKPSKINWKKFKLKSKIYRIYVVDRVDETTQFFSIKCLLSQVEILRSVWYWIKYFCIYFWISSLFKLFSFSFVLIHWNTLYCWNYVHTNYVAILHVHRNAKFKIFFLRFFCISYILLTRSDKFLNTFYFVRTIEAQLK